MDDGRKAFATTAKHEDGEGGDQALLSATWRVAICNSVVYERKLT